jgi:hypothetical protein
MSSKSAKTKEEYRRLLKARRMATRSRSEAACVPCKVRKIKCSDSRPCSRCSSEDPGGCFDRSSDVEVVRAAGGRYSEQCWVPSELIHKSSIIVEPLSASFQQPTITSPYHFSIPAQPQLRMAQSYISEKLNTFLGFERVSAIPQAALTVSGDGVTSATTVSTSGTTREPSISDSIRNPPIHLTSNMSSDLTPYLTSSDTAESTAWPSAAACGAGGDGDGRGRVGGGGGEWAWEATGGPGRGLPFGADFDHFNN